MPFRIAPMEILPTYSDRRRAGLKKTHTLSKLTDVINNINKENHAYFHFTLSASLQRIVYELYIIILRKEFNNYEFSQISTSMQ
jgi:hypothetical protein